MVRVGEEGHVLDVAMAGEPGEGHPEVMKLEVRKQRQRRMEAITAKVIRKHLSVMFVAI